MHTWVWAVILFVVGLVEFFIDEYQKVVSVRLKIFEATIFSTLNHYFDFFTHLFLFGMIIDFWEKFHAGIIAVGTLIPYVAYIHGCIAGTAVALIFYKWRKRKGDKERRGRYLEKGREKKKQYSGLKTDVTMEIEEEMVDDDRLDPIQHEDIIHKVKEEVKEELKQELLEDATAEDLYNQVESIGTEPKEEERSKSPTPEAGPSDKKA